VTVSAGPDDGTEPARVSVTRADGITARSGRALAELDDLELVRAHVDGESGAFAELFRRHRDRLWAVALRTLGDREEAADALQDALLSAHRGAGRFRGDSAVTTWLHRIVVNACLDRIRRRQAHPTVPLLEGSRTSATGRSTGGTEPAAPMPDRDAVLDVRQALAQLPPEQRAALILVDVQGYSVAEVAVILGVAEGTVKSRCARGRARLAVILGHLRTGELPDPGHLGPNWKAGERAARAATPRSPTGVRSLTPGNPASGGDVPSGSTHAASDAGREDM
jgi:RNA polymerase sigma-70 factor (ECF subfamily)